MLVVPPGAHRSRLTPAPDVRRGGEASRQRTEKRNTLQVHGVDERDGCDEPAICRRASVWRGGASPLAPVFASIGSSAPLRRGEARAASGHHVRIGVAPITQQQRRRTRRVERGSGGWISKRLGGKRPVAYALSQAGLRATPHETVHCSGNSAHRAQGLFSHHSRRGFDSQPHRKRRCQLHCPPL